jgi:ATP-dependent Lon protease
MSIVPRNTIMPKKVDLEYRHIRAITLFQKIYKHKRNILRELNNELEVIYDTLVSITNNISNNYIGQVIVQENYLMYLNKADTLLSTLSDVPRPLNLRDIADKPEYQYTISYLSYQVAELIKVCGASSCFDVFTCLVGPTWDLAIKPHHNRILSLYNTMFVPINVKLTGIESIDMKVLKYSSFTVSLLLKINGAEIHIPFYDRTLIIKGYFRDDPLNISRCGGTLEEKYNILIDTASDRYGNHPQFLSRYIEQISLRDFLCSDTQVLMNMLSSDLDELEAMKAKPIGHVAEEFLKSKLKKQYNILTLLLLDNGTHEHAKNIIATMMAQDSDKLSTLFRILHWSVQKIFNDLSKTIDKDTGIGMDENVLPYETRIENMKCSENIRRKAREKLKEIKNSRDGNDKATKYLDGLLQIPFGIYRKEQILRFLDEFRDRMDTTVAGLEDYLKSQSEVTDPDYHTYDSDDVLNTLLPKLKAGHHTENEIDNMAATLLDDRDDLLDSDMSDFALDFTNHFEEMWESWSNFKVERKQYLTQVDTVLSNCIHGQDEAKRRIESLTAQWINGEMSGVVFGFQGYPGTGKTTLARQGISKCLIDENGDPRPFYMISLGGSTGSSTLIGHGYTYVGSQWGKLVDCLREAKVMNPILYFDELDKVSDTPRGEEIIRVLTHLTDPEQNSEITDRYFNIPFDFSKALIIFSYNNREKIDDILMDRIYEVKFKQYKKKDKVHIGKMYILPRILKSAGFSADTVTFTEEILGYIVENYTIEAGVRDMKDKLTEIVREFNLRRIYDEEKYQLPYEIDEDLVDDILKRQNKITITEIPKKSQIGWVNGLYATSVGTGGITVIQAFDTPADKKYSLELTGKLGDVMKESVRCAKTIGWRIFKAEDKKRVDKEWSDNALHIHFPAAGTPKDGPSAGAAITTAFISYFSKLPVHNYIAMTGEIDLYGNVRAIGGLQCKIEGAQRAGVKLILIPRDNESDYQEFKDDYHVRVVPVDNISQVIRVCLIGATDESFNYMHEIRSEHDETTRTILEYIEELETPPVPLTDVPPDEP